MKDPRVSRNRLRQADNRAALVDAIAIHEAIVPAKRTQVAPQPVFDPKRVIGDIALEEGISGDLTRRVDAVREAGRSTSSTQIVHHAIFPEERVRHEIAGEIRGTEDASLAIDALRDAARPAERAEIEHRGVSV